MKKIQPLNYQLLRKRLNLSELPFTNTTKIKPLTKFIGQARALEALNFGIGIKSQGYNLYAMGPSGMGKRTLIQMVLKSYAKSNPVPPDWCYIHNFAIPEKPIALQLPPGKGSQLQQDMKIMIEEIFANITKIFESKEYNSGIRKIRNEFNPKKNGKNGKSVSLSNAKIFTQYKKKLEKERKFQEKLLNTAVEPRIKKLKKKYHSYHLVIDYLNAIHEDIIKHINDFVKQDEKTNLYTFSPENPALVKYAVNLLVDNSKLKGAPIVFEDNPFYSNLISRIEHTTQDGLLVTNFSLIRPGSLHIANGGYLVIEARKLKKNREAWEALKNALYMRQIKIESIQHISDSLKAISLEPSPIPLNIKIVLLGDRNTYYTLCQYDSDFVQLFKIPVDFNEQIERNKKNIGLYARLISTIIKRDKLHPFHASAVAAIIEHSSRLAEDMQKLSTHIRDIEDLILEANHWASLANKKIVKAVDVKCAIDAQAHRMDRAREIYYEDINRDFIIIKTAGKFIGQVNCLSVRRVGNFSYGHPTRVTARVKLGKGKFIDIQREIKMAGPFHSKAGLTISNFLASRFSPDQLFSLSASIAFEQVYVWTDGDSASVGELCAILSALAKLPILQSLAITGSIDQHGAVQAVGGVNEKIEGFFDVCKARGLTGSQGVLIPAVNKKNLMLKEEILVAAKAKKFSIYPITTIDEAIFLLTGIPAGVRNKDGQYPKNSVYYKIEKHLALLSKNRKKNSPGTLL